MPTKKKSKPLFEIPRAIQSAPQSGWVYRSSGGPESGAGYRAPAVTAHLSNILEASALSMAYGMEAAGKTLILSTQFLMMPWNMAMSMTRAWVRRD